MIASIFLLILPEDVKCDIEVNFAILGAELVLVVAG
jgi:hypothetical protein